MGTVLMLERDNVVIGGGLSGLVAAMQLKGSTLLLSYGMGETAISTGVLSFPASRDLQAERWFLDLMSDSRCPYVEGKCLTEAGSIREGLVQASTVLKGSPVPITFNTEKPGYASVTFMKGSSYQEMAKTIECDDRAISELADALRGLNLKCIALPPVLGISRAPEIREHISKSVGADVCEYVTAPSALGLRLVMSLWEKAREHTEILELTKVDRIGDGHVEGRMGTKGRREIRVRADSLVIATGGLLTGFRVSGDRLYEPLTDTTVADDFESCLDPSFASDHPLMRKGIGLRPFKTCGFDSVRAVGAAATGFGLYGALVSGFRAGDHV
jgi:glycerol-3-phosphate dehydrogenase subunit B